MRILRVLKILSVLKMLIECVWDYVGVCWVLTHGNVVEAKDRHIETGEGQSS